MADHVVQGEGDLLRDPGKEGTDGLRAVVDPEVAAPIPYGIVREERGEAIGVIVGVTQPSVSYLELPHAFNVLKPLDAFLQSGHHALLSWPHDDLAPEHRSSDENTLPGNQLLLGVEEISTLLCA
jgi:hypothetical protein